MDKITSINLCIKIFNLNYNVINKSFTYQFFIAEALKFSNNDLLKLSNKFDTAFIDSELILIKTTPEKTLNIEQNNRIFKIEPEQIVSFAKKYKLGIELTDDNLTTAIPNKTITRLLIKLLTDDYLLSEFTKSLNYSCGRYRQNS